MAKRVLLADDDPTLRLLMKELLQTRFDAEVIEAADGLEAWEKFQSGPAPCLCILDVRMPKEGGLSLLARLRADPRFRRQMVMLCSTVHSRATILEAAKLRVDAFLIKPFQGDEFLDRVDLLFRKSGTAGLPPLEPTDVVVKRLGIGTEVYLRLLGVFCRDVGAFLESYSDSSAHPEEDFQLRVSAIKGASSSLGTAGLTDLFASLEQFDSHHSPQILPILKAIGDEQQRVQAALAGLQQKDASADPRPGL
jgi:two-component system chemotaxis response regulator CheY